MSQDWDIFTDDIDPEPEQSFQNPIPSSLHNIWDNQQSSSYYNQPNELPNPDFNLMPPGTNPLHNPTHVLPESAPSSPFIFNAPSPHQRVMLQNRPNNVTLGDMKFYQVEFHPNHIHIFSCPKKLGVIQNDYVVTEADRGYDVGKVITEIERPSTRDIRVAKIIQRKATENEIARLEQKAIQEENAIKVCQQKANELKLPMTIMGAELQFDGKKLTFYYSANDYIDFRDLVRILFKVFGTRIWMV